MIANREADMCLIIFFCGFMLALQIVVLLYVVNAAEEKGVFEGKFPPAIPIVVYFVSTALVFLTGSIIPYI